MLTQQLQKAFSQCPLVAIIRGITPSQVERVGNTLLDAGIRIIEIPLNSPEPFISLERLAKIMPDDGVCGAGTVTQPQQVKDVYNAGGQIIVSPDCNTQVIHASLDSGMIPMPGCLTPTEIFSAINAGANMIKVFPIGSLGAHYLKSLHVVIPDSITTIAVGGIDADNMQSYWQAGAKGFGLASNLYHPDDNIEKTRRNAKNMVSTIKQITQ